jgi:hypothetical protein
VLVDERCVLPTWIAAHVSSGWRTTAWDSCLLPPSRASAFSASSTIPVSLPPGTTIIGSLARIRSPTIRDICSAIALFAGLVNSTFQSSGSSNHVRSSLDAMTKPEIRAGGVVILCYKLFAGVAPSSA